MYILSLFPSQIPTFWAIAYRSVYSKVNTAGHFSNILIEILFTNGSAAFCLRQKFRRDLPEKITC